MKDVLSVSPLPVLTRKPTCKKCGGSLFLDDDELHCVSCGARHNPDGSLFIPHHITAADLVDDVLADVGVNSVSERIRTGRRTADEERKRFPVIIPLDTERERDREWYRPGEIKFTRRQVYWLILHERELREGVWPGPVTGYSDNVRARRASGRNAGFTTASEILSEFRARFEKTGLDGYILKLIVLGESRVSITRQLQALKMTSEKVNGAFNRALYFMSGWERKTESYKEWRRRVKR